MSERYSAAETTNPPIDPVERTAAQAEVGTDRQAACAELASECQEAHNQTPTDRLCWVCAEEGLNLDGTEPTELLQENKLLAAGFRKPLPMAPPLRQRCVELLRERLGEGVAPPAVANEAVAEQQATLAAEETAAEAAQARAQAEAARADEIEATNQERQERNSTTAAERDAALLDEEGAEDREAASLEEIETIFSTMPPGTIDEYGTAVKHELKEQGFVGDALQDRLAQANQILDRYAQQLSGLQAVFTPQEVQQVFGGSLTETVSLNLAAKSKADIYRDVFTRIDAGIQDDDRRRQVRAQVEAQLGIQLTTPERPNNASELQSTLKNGRGTEEVTEVQRVQDPVTGEWTEQEVVVGTKSIPFTERDPLVLSKSPSVVVFPQTDTEGNTLYTVQAAVEGSDPVNLDINIPLEGEFPAEDINNGVNEHLINAVMRNRGMGGVMEALYGRGDSTFGLEGQTDLDSIGKNDITQAFVYMATGENTTLGGRFLRPDELATMADDAARWMTPGGDFDYANQVDPQTANSLMTALFGAGKSDIIANMRRANQFVNTGGAETPSYERLYAQMYPDDAANGYAQLKELAGGDAVAHLDLEGGDMTQVE